MGNKSIRNTHGRTDGERKRESIISSESREFAFFTTHYNDDDDDDTMSAHKQSLLFLLSGPTRRLAENVAKKLKLMTVFLFRNES